MKVEVFRVQSASSEDCESIPVYLFILQIQGQPVSLIRSKSVSLICFYAVFPRVHILSCGQPPYNLKWTNFLLLLQYWTVSKFVLSDFERCRSLQLTTVFTCLSSA
jgi:hypothetical protein